MKCLRCGYCCCHYLVVILIDPDKGLVEENTAIRGADSPERCPHLQGDKPGAFSCALHDHPIYPQTPCAQHNADDSDAPCRLGKYVLENPKSMDEANWQKMRISSARSEEN